MCGIVAAQLREPWLIARQLDDALGTISHRGPDGRSSWISPDRLTALGHVRLSIIGLNNGTQPLKNARGNLYAVVNGEFYGYKAIRQSLREKGYHFATETDSEIAVHLYDEHGLAFVNHLRGEFALVIADRRSGELVAVRDRFGIKPLFYAAINGEVLFASEAKALLALGVTARWDHRGVLEDFAGTRTNRSLFADIVQVPPGCLAVAKDGCVRIEQYWDNVYPTSAVLGLDKREDAEVVSGFRDVFDDAIKERLTADVEVACYLSGGLDSSATLGVAQTHLKHPIHAFTIMFDGEEYDESPLAERTAAFTGSKYSALRVSARDMADALEDSVWHGERPFFNANVTAKFLLSQAVRAAGIKVVLTGEGADEMLAGYQTEQRDYLVNDNKNKDAPDEQAAISSLLANPAVRAFMFHEGECAPGLDVLNAELGYRPSFIEGFSIQYQAVRELMRREIFSLKDISATYDAFLKELDLSVLTGRDNVNQSLYIWQKSMLVNYVLTVLGDRMEMSHSVEGRVPFLDHRVAEYTAALPLKYKIRGGIEKYILREATRDVITPELYKRRKHPFFAPPLRQAIQDSTADPLRVCCEDVIRSSNFGDQPFFDQIKARAFLDKAAEGRIPADVAAAATVRMATLSIMQRRFSI
jgi:asparagine synthase (glutamine-hydrolysing)